MLHYFRNPQIEEGRRNIILQNRCGNRLTLLFGEDQTRLEFVYKPNAFRRKDYRARNFSNRDNFTTLFRQSDLPQMKVGEVVAFDYDPFVTAFATATASGAKNRITVVNCADENAFALAARAPLLLSFSPHRQFEVEDGLLWERFEERGEEIVSYISFAGFEANRYRVLENGEHIVQIMENEVVLIGAEETRYHVKRAVARWSGLSLSALIEQNERLLAPALAKGHLSCRDAVWQKTLDLNRRMAYSGLDEGGACFGALNRIYHLIWVRDGSMTASLMARCGNPDYLRLFAPFLLNNPSRVRREDGSMVAEFSQILGTRWSKSEDDGIFYAFLALFTHFVTTGDDALMRGPEFQTALEALDRFLEKAWEPDVDLIGSDTRGESALASNPYFGYDVVSGRIEEANSHEGAGDPEKARLARCYSLYNNVNTYNVLLMAAALLPQWPGDHQSQAARYLAIAQRLQNKLRGDWVDDTGHLHASFDRYTDGSSAWTAYTKGVDYWEYAWAVSLGPFFPVPELQLKSARLVRELWPKMRDYGFCPWNTLSRILREYGQKVADYEAMLQPEIDDAWILSERYPMRGALGEYIGAVNDPDAIYTSWRALPFTAGSLFFSVTSQLLQSLPMGLAVRGGTSLERVDDFQFGNARLEVMAEGEGEAVGAVEINGEALSGTLQIPQQWLRPGRNTVRIGRTTRREQPLLYSSNCTLFDVRPLAGGAELSMHSEIPAQFVFTHYSALKEVTVESDGRVLPCRVRPLDGDTYTLVETVETGRPGSFLLRMTWCS